MAEAKVKVKVEGEQSYKKALQNINAQNKALNSELKKVKSSFTENTTAQEKARKTSEVLTKQQTALKDKLALLQKEYDKVADKCGENSTEALKLKDSMNKVETELNKVNNELSDCAKELNKTGDEAKESTSKFNKFKTAMNSLGVDTKSVSSKLNSFSNTLTKGLVAGCAAAVTGIAKLIKSSVELYSETEQLKGGIQKLYGEDFIKVLNNANNAYKTVGVSANTYMESVTKFSAALINSLGGDTVKAAELADVAMRAISDNANTFGTDIESLITTYQGFAKANYTMLDNLNLGFAGTKEGMQALLDKATEISGVKFDISSFSDIVQAIQIVQEQMGIAGTTAKEAATTIQGSLDSMSAAWQNLLAGLADPDADIGMLVDNMMNAASTAMKNLVPVIQRAAENIPKALKRAFPEARKEIEAFESGLQSLMKIISSTAPLLKVFTTNIGDFVAFGAGIAGTTKILGNLGGTIEGLKGVKNVKTAWLDMRDAFKQSDAAISTAGNSLKGLSKTLTKSMGDATDYYGVFEKAVSEAGGNLDYVGNACERSMKSFENFNGVVKSNSQAIVNNIGSIISTVATVAAVIGTVIAIIKQAHDEAVAKIRDLSESEQELKDATDDVTESIKSQREEIEKDRAATDGELNYIQRLTSELTTLVDANGKVSDANKSRVQFILTEMNSALGTEYELTGNLISGYGTLTDKVYALIEAKRQEVYMEGAYEKWKSAIQGQEDVIEHSKQSYADYYSYINSQDFNEIEQKYLHYKNLIESGQNSLFINFSYIEWEDKYNAAKEHADELYNIYRQDTKNVAQYTSDIANYEAAYVAQQAGDTTAMLDILKNGITEKTEKYRQSIKVEKEYTQAEIDEYVKRKNNALNKYAEIKAEYDKASETEQEALKTKLQNALDEVTNTIDPDIDKVIETGNAIGYAYIDGVITKIDEGTTDIENATTDAVDNATDKAADNASTGGTKVAANCIGGVTSALLGDKSISNSLVSILSNAISNGEQTGNTSTSIATAIIGAITGPIGSSYLLLNCLKNAVKGAKDNASGVDTSSVGKNMISGIGTGITNNEWSLKKTFWGSVSNAITWVKTKLGIQSPSKMMRDVIGKNLMLGLAEGIKVGTSDVIKASSVAMGKIATSFETPLTQNVKLDTDSMNSALQYNIKVANQTKDMELAFKSAMNGMAVVMDGDRFGSFVSDTVLYGRPNVEGVY